METNSKELIVQGFTFNDFMENTYVLGERGGEVCVIDPGCNSDEEWSTLCQFLAKEACKPVAILLTHGHLDHIFGVERARTAWGVPVAMHPGDLPLVERAQAQAQMWGLKLGNVRPPELELTNGQMLGLAGCSIRVIHTPGHSPGGVCLYLQAQDLLFAGDTLFNGSIGRTDLPGGDYATLIDSIQTRLMPLPDDTLVLCGHGPQTTIGQERAHNPFLAG